ncbi:hypothetical protein ES703_05073 [subsurface metagenome]
MRSTRTLETVIGAQLGVKDGFSRSIHAAHPDGSAELVCIIGEDMADIEAGTVGISVQVFEVPFFQSSIGGSHDAADIGFPLAEILLDP